MRAVLDEFPACASGNGVCKGGVSPPAAEMAAGSDPAKELGVCLVPKQLRRSGIATLHVGAVNSSTTITTSTTTSRQTLLCHYAHFLRQRRYVLDP